MKLFFLVVFCLAGAVVMAQDDTIPKKQELKDLPMIYVPKNPKAQTTPLNNNASLLMTLPNGNKVYALSQDNMPCIVPDMSQFSMPNGANPVHPYQYEGPGKIPNPVSNTSAVTVIQVPSKRSINK